MEKDIQEAQAPETHAPILAPARKAYERPQIIYRAPLEAMAAICTPAPPGKALGDGNCTVQFS
jgi:hypothetical protein